MKGRIKVAASIRPCLRTIGCEDRLSGIPNSLQPEMIPVASPNFQWERRYARCKIQHKNRLRQVFDGFVAAIAESKTRRRCLTLTNTATRLGAS